MKLNMKAHYGVLFVMYLHRKGLSGAFDAAKELGLSVNFLEQIARKLRVAGVITSRRGPRGGYEVVGFPTVRDVFEAVEIEPFVDSTTFTKYLKQDQYTRSFLAMTVFLRASMADALDMTVLEILSDGAQRTIPQAVS